MTLRYRFFCGLAVLGFVGIAQPALGQASSQQDSLKGQIWTATAQRLWVDHKPAPKVTPAPWATYTEFDAWRKKNPSDKSGIHQLYGYVLKEFEGRAATAAELAQVIPNQIRQSSTKDRAWLKSLKVEQLTPKLQAIVASAKKVQTKAAVPAKTVAAPVATDAANATEDPNPVPDSSLNREPEPSYSTPISQTDTHFGMPFWAAALALVLVGASIGAALHAFLKPPRRSGRRHREVSISPEADTSTDMLRKERKHKSEIQQLKGTIHHLELRIKEMEDQLASKSAPKPNPTPMSEPEPADKELLTPTPLAPVPTERTSQPAPVTRYGPVQETPFLEERKVSDAPLPQLALMLTLHPGAPEQASFTLNPQVNQNMLIGDGLDRLKKFFDYDLPMGRISSVTAAAPGRLQRQADGWQVVERAKLTVR